MNNGYQTKNFASLIGREIHHLDQWHKNTTPKYHELARAAAAEREWDVAREKMRIGFAAIGRLERYPSANNKIKAHEMYVNEKGMICPVVFPLAATKATRRMARRQKRGDQSWR